MITLDPVCVLMIRIDSSSGLMHTAPSVALDLKAHILKALLAVLRESHRTRTVFRKVGGFVYVMTVLVSMEGCLATPPR